MTATVTVRNTGERAGADVPQLDLESISGAAELQLLGFDKVVLSPGESRTVTITVDPRLLARYDVQAQRWRIAGGKYNVALSRSANEPVERRTIAIRPQLLGGSANAAPPGSCAAWPSHGQSGSVQLAARAGQYQAIDHAANLGKHASASRPDRGDRRDRARVVVQDLDDGAVPKMSADEPHR